MCSQPGVSNRMGIALFYVHERLGRMTCLVVIGASQLCVNGLARVCTCLRVRLNVDIKELGTKLSSIPKQNDIENRL